MMFYTRAPQIFPHCKRSVRSDFSVIVPNYILNPSSDGRTYYWHLVNKTPDLGDLDLIESFRLVFEQLDPLFHPLHFDSTSDVSKAQIRIRFAVDGDPSLPEPFGPGVLAYAFAPVGQYTGHMYINDAWSWAIMHSDQSNDISLPTVLIHEILHLFNVGHTDIREDIMYPTYNPFATITQDTRAAVKLLYGDLKDSIDKADDCDKAILLFRELFPDPKELHRLTERQLVLMGAHMGLDIQVAHLKRDSVAKILAALHTN